MRFGVLGALAVWTSHGEPITIPERKVRALLADLLLHLGRTVPSDRLIDDLWGEDLPAHPAGALQSKISRLRQALEDAEPGGRDLVRTSAPGYLIQVEAEALDRCAFEVLAERARATEDPRDKAALLDKALALWRGPVLADFGDAAFAQPEIVRLTERRLVAVEEWAETRLALGEHDVLAGELHDLVRRHPFRERLRAAHMLALYRAGRQREALDGYRDLHHRMLDELGLRPGPDLTSLHQAILEQSPVLRSPPVPPSRPSTNLPTPLTELVGRTAAVSEVGTLLRHHRLVTLTGPGGVGKTRLAIETARQLTDAFPDGVRLVELATMKPRGTHSPADLIMSVLGVRGDSASDPADRLAEALRASRMLLVLDNCEHLAAPAARLTGRLLQAAPELRVLVTSRESLGLAGEVIWDVPPLEVPATPAPPAATAPTALRAFSAVRLFVARARASAPGFALDAGNAGAVAVICRRLDGIPLALELAAGRVRSLGVHELAARLDDRFRLLDTGHRDAPPRQRTLRAVVDWSWDLLTRPERLVLRRLAVTADGCTLHAAERICAEDGHDVPSLLARLVDRSLVTVVDGPDGRRYRLLETVAAYAGQRLQQAGELDHLRARHRRYYGDLAGRAAPHLRGHDQRRWLRCLDAEAANLRAALDSAAQDNDAPAALRLVNALTWYWFLRGRFKEARHFLDAALALEGPASASERATARAWRAGFTVLAGDRTAQATATPPLDEIEDQTVRATTRWFLGFVASDFGDPSEGEALVAQALASFEALEDPWGIAAALSTRAKQAMIRGDLAAVRCDAERSLAIFRDLGDRWGRLQAIEWLGAVARVDGDRSQATRLHRDALRIAEELGLWPQAADALSWLGRNALHAGDLVQARELFERAIRIATERSYKPGQVFAEIGLGLTARREGELDLAETHMHNVLRWVRATGSEPDVALMIALSELGFIAEERGDHATAQALHLDSLATARKLGDPLAVARALVGLADARSLLDAH